MRRHSEGKPWSCSVCATGFSTKLSLAKHSKVCSGSRTEKSVVLKCPSQLDSHRSECGSEEVIEVRVKEEVVDEDEDWDGAVVVKQEVCDADT